MVVFVGIVVAYGSTIVPMVKNVFCFIGVTAWCRQKSWERSDAPIRIESQSQADLQGQGGGLRNFQVEPTAKPVVTEVPVIVVPVTSVPGQGLEVVITSVPEMPIVITELPPPTNIPIVPTNVLPDIPVPPTPVQPIVTPVPTSAPLVDGYDLQGFQALCSAQGSGFVVENQGGVYVCHCPTCP